MRLSRVLLLIYFTLAFFLLWFSVTQKFIAISDTKHPNIMEKGKNVPIYSDSMPGIFREGSTALQPGSFGPDLNTGATSIPVIHSSTDMSTQLQDLSVEIEDSEERAASNSPAVDHLKFGSGSQRRFVSEDMAPARPAITNIVRERLALSPVRSQKGMVDGTMELSTPLLTFYLHGELSVRLASFAIGVAYAKMHGYHFRSFWELDEDCSTGFETMFDTGGDGPSMRLPRCPPANEGLPTFAECGEDLTECLKAKQDTVVRVSFERLPRQDEAFVSEARSALSGLSLNPEWAKRLGPNMGTTEESVVVIFDSPSKDDGLGSFVETAGSITPLIHALNSALLNSDNTKLSLHVVSSHQSVGTVLKAYYTRNVATIRLSLLGRNSTVSTRLLAMSGMLGLVPNLKVEQVISTSRGPHPLLAPSLLGLLDSESVKHTRVVCPSANHHSHTAVSGSTNGSGALYIVGFDLAKDVSRAFSNFYRKELGRSVDSFSQAHADDPIDIAAFSSIPLWNSTTRQLSHHLPVNVTFALGNYEVASALRSRRGATALRPKRLPKIKHMAQSPFQYTLYLDTDTFTCESLRPCFRLLQEQSEFDIFVAKGDNGKSSWNSGVILYRRCAAMDAFFRLWEHLYMFNCALPGRNDQDQCALPEAIDSFPGLRIGVLPPSCHLRMFLDDWRDASSGRASQRIPKGEVVRLVHDRFFNPTTYRAPQLCKLVNNDSSRERVLSESDGIPIMRFKSGDCEGNEAPGCSS